MSAKSVREWCVRSAFWVVMALIVVVILISATAADEKRIGAVVKDMLEAARQEAEFLTVDELSALMESGQEIALVDVRTGAEFDAGHLRGAQWIPRGKLEFLAEERFSSSDAEIVVYCKRDGRSCLAAVTLERLGFKRAKYLRGGFEPWVMSGKPIYNMHGELVVKAFEKSEED